MDRTPSFFCGSSWKGGPGHKFQRSETGLFCCRLERGGACALRGGLHQRHIDGSRRKEPDEPCVVVQEMERLEEEADEGEADAERQRKNRARVHAPGVVI